MDNKYFARPGGPLSNEQANALGEELERMAVEGVAATPEAVVERARDASSPIHDLFEWNDARAADKYRLHQARTSIAAIVVRDPASGSMARAAFSVQIQRDGDVRREYVSRNVVLEKNDLAEQVSRDLYKRVQSAALEAERAGLHRGSEHWRRIVDAIRANEPVFLTAESA